MPDENVVDASLMGREKLIQRQRIGKRKGERRSDAGYKIVEKCEGYDRQ